MKTNQQPFKRSQQPNGKPDKKSSSVMRVFYVLMLVLMFSSSLIRIVGASRHPQSAPTPAPQVDPVHAGGTAARIFSFHAEDSGAGTCRDLVISATGNAVYSDCGKGLEKQYSLNDAENAQIRGWIAQFQPINDTQTAGTISTQLYLNGQGSQAASEPELQAMLQFAETLAAKIISQP